MTFSFVLAMDLLSFTLLLPFSSFTDAKLNILLITADDLITGSR